MDLTEPGLAFSGPLTMHILRALDGRSQPATAAQVARVAELGTQAGVRRALERLVLHGVCRRHEIAGRIVYSLNYHHILYPAVRRALDASDIFLRTLRRDLTEWEIEPESAILFGSAARRNGDVDSDIDILLIRPKMTRGLLERTWNPQVHGLRDTIFERTGNPLQLFDWPLIDLRVHVRREPALVDEILKDGIVLSGAPLDELVDVPRRRRA